MGCLLWFAEWTVQLSPGQLRESPPPSLKPYSASIVTNLLFPGSKYSCAVTASNIPKNNIDNY